MPERVLITGGAGYVGTTLVAELLSRGKAVRVFDSLMFGGEQLLPFFQDVDFDFVKGDVRDYSAFANAARGCDAIIHLAAISGLPACKAHPFLARQVNLEGTKNAAEVAGPRPIIYASTVSVYGDAGRDCDETMPIRPISLYGSTKAEAEQFLLDNANAVAPRFATAFGLAPKVRFSLLTNDFVLRALTERYLVVYEPNATRTFVHVRDMARAFAFILENFKAMAGQVFNVGNETMNCTKRELALLVQAYTNCEIYYSDTGQDPDKRDYSICYGKIKAAGYKATISLEEGIRELVRGLSVLGASDQQSNA